jgi:hypothetical protein
VIRVPIETAAAERARWLAELAQTLDQAQQLISELGSVRGSSSAALDLSARVEAARAEVRSLRIRIADLSGQSRREWSKNIPWHRSPPSHDG